MSATPPSSVVIRPIQVADIPDFHRVLSSVCHERKYLAALEPPSLESTERFIRANVQRHHPQYVALVHGQLAGWCDAVPGDASSGNAHIGRLGMGVAKAARRQGLGAKLMHAVLDKAREIGLVKIELAVYASNTGAIALYQRFGFEEEGRRIRGRCVDGHYDDVVLMGLFLDACTCATMKPAPEDDLTRDGIHFRRAGKEDTTAIAAIHRAAFRGALPHIPELHTHAEHLDFFTRVVARHGAATWLAVSSMAGEPLGFITFCPGAVEHLYVHPAHQGQGLGTALLRLAMQENAELKLWAFQRNAGARRFYERHGFTADRMTDGMGNEEREPDMRYVWKRTTANRT